MSTFNVPEGWMLVPVEPTQEMLDARCEDGEFAVHADEYYFADRDDVRGFSAYLWQHMLAAAPAAPAVQGEPVEFDYPEFHEHGMGCGLEDRGITDRYEAMRYGWDEALDRVAEIIDGIGPLYAAPQPAQQQPAPDVAGLVEALESAIKAFEEIQGGCATDRDICREEATKIRAALAGKGGAQ